MAVFRNDRSSHPVFSYADGIATGAVGDFFLLAARVLGGTYFTMAGWGKVINDAGAGFAASQIQKGVPAALAYIAPYAEFLGGLALVVGFATRYAALGLFLFTLIATYLSHRYWTFPVEQQQMQRGQFWKNVTIMGGQLALFVAGPGRISLDRWLSRRLDCGARSSGIDSRTGRLPPTADAGLDPWKERVP